MNAVHDSHNESTQSLLNQEDTIQLHELSADELDGHRQSFQMDRSNRQEPRYQSTQNLTVPNLASSRNSTPSPPSTRSNSPLRNEECKKTIPTALQSGSNLRRFRFRGLVGIIVPPLLTIYYCFIWGFYLQPSSTANPISFGPVGAQWIYYSWFIIGVVGLNASTYGLEGIEASMMMERRWAVDDAVQVMMHGDRSWTGPGGWIKVLNNLVKYRKMDSAHLWPSKLWILLSFLNSIVYLALPISGLVMNLGGGYTKSTISPNVTGFSYDNFNEQRTSSTPNNFNWQYNVAPRIPGLGVIYTTQGLDRSNSNLSYLQQLPNTLPTDDGVPQIFLTSQASVPVTGNSWGLAVKYNCSVITNISDFTILRYRNSSKSIFGPDPHSFYNTPNNDTIYVYNETLSSIIEMPLWVDNIEAVIELGYPTWPPYPYIYDASDPYSTSCYYTARPDVTGKYPGLEQELAFEAILWQGLYPQAGYVNPIPTYNLSISSTIPELEGVYNSVFNVSMPAIGVQCYSSSAVGSADIDGIHSTFSNFQATDSPILNLTNDCTTRLGPELIFSTLASMMDQGQEWLKGLFNSVNAPPPLFARYDTGDPSDEGTGTFLQLTYFQAEDLRHAFLRLYSLSAAGIMYNGGQGYYNTPGGLQSNEIKNTNVTAFQPASLLQVGVVPPIFPGVLLILWAVLSSTLGCIYGFRRRWAATLDGYSLFVFGVDVAEKMTSQLHISAMVECEKAEVLRHIPGLIGDGNPGSGLGRIGLVASSWVADKNKKYA